MQIKNKLPRLITKLDYKPTTPHVLSDVLGDLGLGSQHDGEDASHEQQQEDGGQHQEVGE